MEIFKSLAEYGVLAAVLAVMFFYMFRKDKCHQAERESWQKQITEQYDKMLNAFKENTEAFISLKDIIKK